MKSWYTITNRSEALAEIQIYDEIGLYGVSAKDFAESLKSVGTRRILLRLNSPGGDVFDGMAIYNRLREHTPGVEVRIDGVAASMASVIAMVGAPVRIAENALMMVHNPNGLVAGNAADMRDMASLLDKLRASLIGAYERKTGLSTAKLQDMLDAETWLNATEAKELRFVDEISEPLKIAARFDSTKFRHAPKSLSSCNPTSDMILRSSIITALALSETSDKPLTDEQITAKLSEQLGNVVAVTTERDTLKGSLTAAQGEVTRLTGQFEAVSKTATEAQTKVTELTGQLTAITTERDTAKTSLATANTNVERLETVCRLRGVNPAAAVPSVDQQPAPEAKTVDQFNSELANAKTPEARNAVLKAFAKASKEGLIAKEA